jgi:hypothetical protein
MQYGKAVYGPHQIPVRYRHDQSADTPLEKLFNYLNELMEQLCRLVNS